MKHRTSRTGNSSVSPTVSYPCSSRRLDNVRRPSARGGVTVITGCMFSGKTTRLLRRIEACPGGQVLAIKHAIDRRYRADAIVSHAGKAHPATSVSRAAHIPEHVRPEIRFIAIDEAHFFDSALVDVVDRLAGRQVDVIITALDRDSWGRPFEMVRQLMEQADESVPVCAVCARCGGVGDFTHRLTPIIGSDMVGGPESYEPRCRACWRPPPEAPLD